MSDTQSSTSVTPLEAMAELKSSRRHLTIGLPACKTSGENRFPLTPEGVHRLIERGFLVMMESGAADIIHYQDTHYTRNGVTLCSRATALGCDIVIHLAPLSVADCRSLRRGALLLTLSHAEMRNADNVMPLLQHHVSVIALDLIEDSMGNTPYADILAEIDGRAAMTLGAALLADTVRGKGILLGGVAGIVPCEVMVLGSGIAACAAARVASGLGAMVRMFDDNVYSLRRSVRDLGSWVVASSLHPHVLEGALRSADVIVAAPGSSKVVIGGELVGLIKSGAVIIDLSCRPGATFPNLPAIDISDAGAIGNARRKQERICLVNPGVTVARTAAMAMSDTLLTTFERLFSFNSLAEALSRLPGLRRSVLTYQGRVVNSVIAHAARVRQVDISIYLTLS